MSPYPPPYPPYAYAPAHLPRQCPGAAKGLAITLIVLASIAALLNLVGLAFTGESTDEWADPATAAMYADHPELETVDVVHSLVALALAIATIISCSMLLKGKPAARMWMFMITAGWILLNVVGTGVSLTYEVPYQEQYNPELAEAGAGGAMAVIAVVMALVIVGGLSLWTVMVVNSPRTRAWLEGKPDPRMAAYGMPGGYPPGPYGPPPGYGPPMQGGYGGGYGAPPPGYGAPPPGYGGPPRGYGAPSGYRPPPATPHAPRPPAVPGSNAPQSPSPYQQQQPQYPQQQQQQQPNQPPPGRMPPPPGHQPPGRMPPPMPPQRPQPPR